MKAVKLSVAALALSLAATPAAAQLAGQPVYAIPKGTGVSINADFGISIDPGSFNTAAARVTLGMPMIRFQAGFEPNMLDAGESQLAVGAAFSLMPMPVSLAIQAGLGYGMDSEAMTIPVGVVIGLNVPSVAMSVDPWIFPQIRHVRVDVLGTTASNTDFGLSAGVNVSLPAGIGGHLALDYDNASEAITAGIGLHYKIAVPGLGMM